MSTEKQTAASKPRTVPPATGTPPSAPALRYKPTTTSIHRRIMAVMGGVSKLEPKGYNIDDDFKFVEYSAIVEAVRAAMIENGILLISTVKKSEQDGNTTALFVVNRYINADEPDDFVEQVTLGYGADSTDKGPGKAFTYAVKQSLLKMFQLVTDDADPDAGSTKRTEGSRPETTPSIGHTADGRAVEAGAPSAEEGFMSKRDLQEYAQVIQGAPSMDALRTAWADVLASIEKCPKDEIARAQLTAHKERRKKELLARERKAMEDGGNGEGEGTE